MAPRPARSLTLTIGLALLIGSVIDLLVDMRALHLVAHCGAAGGAAAVLWCGWPGNSGHARRPSPAPEPTLQLRPGYWHGAERPARRGHHRAAALPRPYPRRAAQAHGQADEIKDRESQSAIRQFVFVISSANYTGTVSEKVAQFEATLQISTFTTNQIVPLFGDDVALEAFSTKTADVKLLRQGRGIALRLGERGSATVQLKLVAKLGGDVSKRQLAFVIPPALSSQLAMNIDEAEADVEFPTAIAFKRAPEGNRHASKPFSVRATAWRCFGRRA